MELLTAKKDRYYFLSTKFGIQFFRTTSTISEGASKTRMESSLIPLSFYMIYLQMPFWSALILIFTILQCTLL